MTHSISTHKLEGDPRLRELYRAAEGRHFKDEELTELEQGWPELAPRLAAARAVRDHDLAVIRRVVTEVFAQYTYEKNHEHAQAKCPRDIRYVVCYAVQSMILEDPGWFDNKVLLWLKTILQAFEFPERSRAASRALFADKELEAGLAACNRRTRSIYHTYYRLLVEMRKDLEPAHFALMEPYLRQALETLTEVA